MIQVSFQKEFYTSNVSFLFFFVFYAREVVLLLLAVDPIDDDVLQRIPRIGGQRLAPPFDDDGWFWLCWYTFSSALSSTPMIFMSSKDTR